jgi:penicillin-binding protein 1A
LKRVWVESRYQRARRLNGVADEKDPDRPDDDPPVTPPGEPSVRRAEGAPEGTDGDETPAPVEPEPSLFASDAEPGAPEKTPSASEPVFTAAPPPDGVPPAPETDLESIDPGQIFDVSTEAHPPPLFVADPEHETASPEPAAEVEPEPSIKPEPDVAAGPEPEPQPPVDAFPPMEIIDDAAAVEEDSPAAAAEDVFEPEPEPALSEPQAEPEADLVHAQTPPEPEPEAEAESEPEPEAVTEPTGPEATAIDARESDAPLPPHFFRAAGDPDEPPPEQDTRFLARLGARLRAIWTKLRSWGEPKYVAAAGAARGLGGAITEGVKHVKPPRNVRETAVWAGWAAGALVASLVAFFFFVTWGMPSTDDLWEARQGQSITFLDRNGNVILREGAQNAPPVELGSLPPYVAQAFIAIEDKRFYDHWGVDISGVMRAGAENLRAGRVVQGGSTITQQLAKNLFLTNERSWRRKAQEVAMALWLERRFDKDEILALYLSRVYFGAGAYGVEAAAERYFDRPARELTLLQSAMLAGLVKAPSRLNPARQDIAAARERAELVLTEMVAMGFISDAERQAAAQEELVISRRNPAGILGYYRDWIDGLLRDVIGDQRDDFVIETTLDIAAQRAGAEAVEAVLAEQGEERRVDQAALLALDDTGGVRAMVGGRDYDTSQFNRTWQARRQPGSAFKYFIYLAAMENGLTPWSIRQDAPVRISIPGQPDWVPGNYTNEFNGPVSLTTAFAQSYNMVAIRVAHEVGHDHVIDVARRLGVSSPLHNYHSLALGAQEVTMLDMAQAYGAMASGGYRVYAHGVVRIRRANSNETMWSWRAPDRTRVIEERPLRFMNAMMERTVQAGTGTRARMPGRQIAGKTGTGNDYRDAWFIGFTPGYVAAVWVGNDNYTVTGRVTGGSLPADIWARFAQTALQNVPIRPLDMPGEDDFDMGAPDPDAIQSVSAVGAPIGAVIGAPDGPPPPDNEDRSLDFGPEG